MLFLAKLDEGEGGNNNADEESDDDEVEDDSVRTDSTILIFYFNLFFRCYYFELFQMIKILWIF